MISDSRGEISLMTTPDELSGRGVGSVGEISGMLGVTASGLFPEFLDLPQPTMIKSKINRIFIQHPPLIREHKLCQDIV